MELHPIADKLKVRLVLAISIFAAATVFAGLASDSATAGSKVFRSVPTQVSFSVTRAPADGTITAQVTYRSKDPRCLAAKRFKRAGMRNEYFQAYVPEWLFGDPPGSEGLGQLRGATLAPVTPFGKSKLVFKVTIPGDTPVAVPSPDPDSTVAKASALKLYVAAPGSNGQGLPYFKVSFHEGGKHVVLKCEQLKGATYDGFAGSEFVIKTFAL